MLAAAMLWSVYAQHRQLATLRAHKARLLASLELSGAAEVLTQPSGDSPQMPNSPELMRLRNQVNQLAQQQRELGGVRAENAQLLNQLTNRVNAAPAAGFPPGFIRMSGARMVGYSSPAETMQTMLWALQTGNITNVLDVFTPEAAAQISQRLQSSGESASENFAHFAKETPGFNILRQEAEPEGSVLVHVEILPAIDPHTFHLRQVNGQWKIADPGP